MTRRVSHLDPTRFPVPGVRHPESVNRQRVPLPAKKALGYARLLDELLGDRWFAVGGTALGAVRDGGVIPWDYDFDAAVLAEDWREFRSWSNFFEKCERLKHRVTRTQKWSADFGWAYSWVLPRSVRNRVSSFRIERPAENFRHHIDVRIMHRGRGMFDQRRFSYRNRGKLAWVPDALFEATREVPWEGRTIRVPARAEDYLAFVYGPRWRDPSYWARTPERKAQESWRVVRTGWEPVVFSGGKWDGLHHGHEAIIERARKLRGRLVLGVLSDASIVARGGDPVRDERTRAAELAAFTKADEIIVYDSFRDVLESYRPVAMVHGEDWADASDAPELAAAARDLGCKILLYPRTPGVSSSELR